MSNGEAEGVVRLEPHGAVRSSDVGSASSATGAAALARPPGNRSRSRDAAQLDSLRVWAERIAHDYLPDRIKGIYDLLTVTYRPEVVAALSAARGYREAARER